MLDERLAPLPVDDPVTDDGRAAPLFTVMKFLQAAESLTPG